MMKRKRGLINYFDNVYYYNINSGFDQHSCDWPEMLLYIVDSRDN